MQKFDSAGNFIAAAGWDVVDGVGQPGAPGDDTVAPINEYEVCTAAATCKAAAPGSGAGQFASGTPSFLATHRTGDVYAVVASSGKIVHLNSSLALVDDPFASAVVTGGGNLRAVAVNTADGHLFLSKQSDTNIYETDATGALVDTHPAGQNGWVGLAVNSMTGQMYAASDGQSFPDFIRVFGEASPTEAVPLPVTGAATDVTIATARLNGTINPNGVALDDCYFEYGRTTAYGTRVDCVPDEATIGSGTSPVAVSADIAGLQPNSTYHFRLAGENANGTANGADRSFSTPETVIAAAAAPIGGTKARLNGSVDPDGVAFTDCYFEYGSTTAYGTRADCVPDPATIGSGTDPVAVSADIAGLTPNGAAYNFRLVAEQGGDPIQSRNQPLTTATTVITESVSALAGTTATLNGLVDPDGVGLKDCSFEYGETTAYGTRVPCNESPGTIGAGAGNVSVSADISGLDLATAYHYRLTATYDHPADPFGAGEDRSLLTLGPTLKDSYAINASDTKATLGALINPGGEATTYRFEYGLTTAYGNQTAELGAGSDSADHTVTTLLEGLTPNTTYHFRAVATNPSGSVSGPDLTVRTTTTAPAQNCPNEAIRAQQGTTHLPACLAYEMVSPPDKNQGSAPRGVIAGPSRDGNAVAFCTSALFGEPAAQMSGISCAPYLSTRTPSGWQTGFPFPQVCVSDHDGNNKTPLSFGGVMDVVLSPNFERAAVERFESEACPLPPLDPAAALPGANFYRQDLSADPFEFDLLSPMAEGGDESSTYGDDDFSHIVYQSSANQTPEPDSPPPGAYPKVYEAVEEGSGGCLTPGGCVRLVSVRPDGAPFATESRVPARLQFGSWISTALGAVSADGSRIFFQNRTVGGSDDANPGSCSTPECELYLRENGLQAQSPLDVDGRCADDALACTYHVSRSECTVDCGVDSSPDRLLAANEAGDVAFFSSCTKLTDASSPTTNCNNNTHYNADSNAKIYRWDRFGTPTRQLVDISVDHEPADGVQGKAIDIAGGAVAADGDVAFFVAGGQIVAGEPLDSGIPGNFKLYRWRFNGGDPRVDYLGPYQPTGGFANTPSLTVSLDFLRLLGRGSQHCPRHGQGHPRRQIPAALDRARLRPGRRHRLHKRHGPLPLGGGGGLALRQLPAAGRALGRGWGREQQARLSHRQRGQHSQRGAHAPRDQRRRAARLLLHLRRARARGRKRRDGLPGQRRSPRPGATRVRHVLPGHLPLGGRPDQPDHLRHRRRAFRPDRRRRLRRPGLLPDPPAPGRLGPGSRHRYLHRPRGRRLPRAAAGSGPLRPELGRLRRSRQLRGERARRRQRRLLRSGQPRPRGEHLQPLLQESPAQAGRGPQSRPPRPGQTGPGAAQGGTQPQPPS